MARIRSIKPQFWLDENLATISRDARLLYIGLWNLADDYGVFEWRPARIKVQLFPWDIDVTGKKVEEWMKALESTGDITKFKSEGKLYGYIPTFLKHQIVRKPSQWRFALIPPDILNNYVQELPTTTPPVGEELPSSDEAVSLGGRGEEKDKSKEKEKEKGEVEVDSTPSPVESSVLKIFLEKFPYAFGREPDSREQAQLRDFAAEVAAGGGATEKQIHDAFAEAAGQNKCNVRYVRAVLLDWLGVQR